ncbi:unnamed protein product [Rangifer tarandus platyrhynchus]|uniref:Uncharacterized protein n=2 Tax=Rangifer tarandus platyrhynchus TaxID=3082113 RepID=A0ACB0FG70_RANTA|nr:unnamed protein product [Rangifer tarandus platyrhynchus]CAI9712067.1 unnamed protein product [Rangifer tarandus platyrhynchus]
MLTRARDVRAGTGPPEAGLRGAAGRGREQSRAERARRWRGARSSRAAVRSALPAGLPTAPAPARGLRPPSGHLAERPPLRRSPRAGPGMSAEGLRPPPAPPGARRP